MTIDDETVRRILDAVFDGVEADVAAEAERGPLVHASNGHRVYARQDGADAVITTVGPHGGTRHEIVGVDVDSLT
jgi:hypothetical protein